MTMNIKTKLLTAVATAAMATAFENKPGWKMDGDKLALDASGNPIYINSAGEEQSVKGDTIANLNSEAKTHRTAKETAEANLAKYKGPDGKLIDPDTAIKAMDTIGKIDAKKLIDAGEVDKVRDTIKAEFAQQITERDTKLGEYESKINSMMIDGVFKGSEFISERVAMPRDFFEAAMRNNFKVEDGKVVAYDKSGNRLMSKKSVGEFADPNEALELLVEHHPQKDTILKAVSGGGTGGGGGGGGRGTGRTMRRADFDALDPGAKAEAGVAMGKGELAVVD